MGSVYRAEQLQPRRQVVIKITPPDVGLPKALLEALSEEGNTAARLRHPNIVTVYDCGKWPFLYWQDYSFSTTVHLFMISTLTRRLVPILSLLIFSLSLGPQLPSV